MRFDYGVCFVWDGVTLDAEEKTDHDNYFDLAGLGRGGAAPVHDCGRVLTLGERFDVGLAESKSRDLGSDRGYRVAAAAFLPKG
jgi:hypothetical protein